MKNRTFTLIAAMLFLIQGAAQTVESPDGRVSATFTTDGGRPSLSILYDGKPAVEHVALGLTVNGTDYAKDVTVHAVSEQERIVESYTMPHGKRSARGNEANAITVTLTKEGAAGLDIELRAYNDGLCFRYGIDNQEGGKLAFTDEQTAYTLPTDAPRWLQQFITSYEGDFPIQHGAERQGAWNYPLLVETAPCYLLITEADANREYCSTHVSNESDKDTYRLSYPFSWEGNGQGDIAPSSTAPAWHSPWRVVIMGDLATIVESTLVEDVSAPTTMTDTGWIEAGRAAWVYWAYNHGTKDYKICCQYVDLAAAMGWEYVLFDWEWDSMTNGGNIADAAVYALSRGVKPLLWYNSGGSHNTVSGTPRDRFLTHENRVKELQWLKSLGFAGVKIDFFESDKQSMMQYYLDILQDCAEAQMLVNFHGSTLPRGWSRTYPHLISMESVYGAEQYNNSPTMTDIASRINCTLPFTRNVVGPMDYTPVTFTDSQHPHTTSYAHELALTVAFESGIQHWADRPEGYYALPYEAQQHMRSVPVAWDETRFLCGYPGTHFAVARRSGTTWYVAALNGDHAPRTITLPLTFLGEGEHLMTTLSDGEHGSQLHITHRTVTSTDEVAITCLPQGGFTIVFEDASYAALQELITVASDLWATADSNKGTEPGQYIESRVETLGRAIERARGVDETATTQQINEAYIALGDAFSLLQTAGTVASYNTKGSLIQPKNGGTDVTTEYLVESSDFQRIDTPKETTYSRFGLLASPWVVTPNLLNQDNATHGGFDSYENGRYISIEKWESGLPAIVDGALYQTTSTELPAGKYHLHLPMSTIWDTLNDGEIVMQVVEGADFLHGDVLASYDMKARHNSHNFTPLDACHFEISRGTTVSIGWKVNIPASHSRRGMRVQAIYLYDEQGNVSSSYIGNYEDVQRSDAPTSHVYYRFGEPRYWTSENYEIYNGTDGVKRGIDNYTGKNCLQLGRWEESATSLNAANHKDSRLYYRVTLPEGRYYIGASYHSMEKDRIGADAYFFVADKVLDTDEVPTQALAYGSMSSASVGSAFHGVEFLLDEEREVLLGWQMDSRATHTEFRAQQVKLLYYGLPLDTDPDTPPTDISHIPAEMVAADVYSTSGQLVRKASAGTEGLPRGVYITQCTKVVVK